MRIRVCHIITKLELGGAQQNTLYTVSHLDPARFDASLVTGPEGILVDDARTAGVPLRTLESLRREVSPARDLVALVALARLLRAERPDIVHTHSSKAGILGRWAAAIAGIPHVVHTIHGYGFHPHQRPLTRRLYVLLERLTGRLATTAFIAVSRENLTTGLSLGLFRDDQVSLIRSGIRLSDFSPRTEPPPTVTGAPVTVGMIACLKAQKAPLDFVEVASRVVAQARSKGGAPDVRFVLVGDGELRGATQARIRREGLADRVALTGWRRDVPELLRSFDILLHTSLWEGLPRVFPEAMATGLPIVATGVGGAPEAIEEGVTGYLLPPGDVEGMARRVLQLAGDPGMRRRLGRAAVERTAPWDINEMVRRQERLYEGLMAGEPARAVALSSQARG